MVVLPVEVFVPSGVHPDLNPFVGVVNIMGNRIVTHLTVPVMHRNPLSLDCGIREFAACSRSNSLDVIPLGADPLGYMEHGIFDTGNGIVSHHISDTTFGAFPVNCESVADLVQYALLKSLERVLKEGDVQPDTNIGAFRSLPCCTNQLALVWV